jgi:glycosyltransferase involved in cell wall biosynthesis
VKPTVALIISSYDMPNYLGRVLQAVEAQDAPPEEVFLADYGSGQESLHLFKSWAAKQPFGCEHVGEEHDGFRKSRILNQAVAKAKSDYLIFLDGDTLPHPRFVSDHRRIAKPGHTVQGHRTLVRHRASRSFGMGEFDADRSQAFWKGQLRSWKTVFRWPAPSRKVRKDLQGVRGNNLAIWRADLVKVNGYNEDFAGLGREDSELMSRLLKAGVRRMEVRGWALCYHLWHMPASRPSQATEKHLKEAMMSGKTACEKGLDQYLAANATVG